MLALLLEIIKQIFLSNAEPEQLPDNIKKMPDSSNKSNKHLNTGECLKCAEILNQYPNFYKPLENWFLDLQKRNPEIHISAAGRGKKEQEDYFKKGASKAKYGESAHNYNAALDLFRLTLSGASFQTLWYIQNVKPEVNKSGFLEYGGDWTHFKDWPHCEVANWKDMVKKKELLLVEPLS